MWQGNYSSWKDVQKVAGGYEESQILTKCKLATLKVKNGEAVYERDSVLFGKKQYAWPLLACLENIALASNSKLYVIDFGGSFGSSYFQNKDFLKKLSFLKWIVVEQKHFVEEGKNCFTDEHLDFAYQVDDIVNKEQPNCLLLSSVLQYLENPAIWLQRFLNYGFTYIIIDRTSFINDQQRLTLQNVPEFIYKASYPCWFFNEEEFLSNFASQYELIADFDSFADHNLVAEDGKQLYWKGFFLKKKK